MSLFFTCKQVSKHLSKEDYEKLPPLQKLSLKFHVLICPVCGAYNRQVMKFQDMVRRLRAREEAELERDDPDAPHLDPEKREKIKAALQRAQAQNNGGQNDVGVKGQNDGMTE
ncbi:MAG: hypothetical protein JJU29_20565 [Verrucomicrobia bacterium]|nr:hypothetical protein [Verrucomicrobiota bacterium]MCH8514185.1 hypothetical protein [Kiritimatiellia bacterium]